MKKYIRFSVFISDYMLVPLSLALLLNIIAYIAEVWWIVNLAILMAGIAIIWFVVWLICNIIDSVLVHEEEKRLEQAIWVIALIRAMSGNQSENDNGKITREDENGNE